jgi:hypothetical protein
MGRSSGHRRRRRVSGRSRGGRRGRRLLGVERVERVGLGLRRSLGRDLMRVGRVKAKTRRRRGPVR